MGCDIHGVWEVRQDRGDGDVRWVNAGDIRTDRSYHAYTILAGVRRWITEERGEKFTVIAEPRGLPKDAGWTAKAAHDDPYGHHSASWLTLREMEAAKAEAIGCWVEQGRGLVREGVTPDDIRMVFWFDG